MDPHRTQMTVVGFVYGALVESFSCEQNARMMAMQSASNSARDMLAELDILYNRARQAAITQEITEVIAGAKSQKKKEKVGFLMKTGKIIRLWVLLSM